MRAVRSPDVFRRRATVFALMIAFLDSVGIGLVIPVVLPLIEEIGHLGMGDAAQVGGLLFAVYSLAMFGFAPLLGTLSDRFGRRPLLLLAVGGLAVDYVLQALAPSLGWLFLGRMVAGLCGASIVIANACLADVSTTETRARAFGLMGAAFGLGFVLGPAIGGVLGDLGTRAPFWTAALLAGLNGLLALLFLPETLPRERRRAARWRDANPLGVFRVFVRHPGVLPYAAVLALYFLGNSVYVGVWVFWGFAKFDWSTTVVGLTLAVAGLGMALLQGLGTGPAVARWGEHRLALIGLAFAALSCVGFGLATTTTAVFLLLMLHGIEGFVHPSVAALMSKRLPEDTQGALQGGIAAIQSLAFLVGTVLFTQVFRMFMTPAAPVQSPDVVFFGASAILAVAFVWLWRRGGRAASRGRISTVADGPGPIDAPDSWVKSPAEGLSDRPRHHR
ncbi:TCR/Tet family MFS transporter [Roseospira marina]|uniref:TCR/Tet family MFS transporter n=1 Tax=Roseospira marina TaxID=140057 RepID=A0A5M6IDI7_9PROT|nr:MFS transporter [Roseospira marina]KAA5606354.1 TCR/Tet family MFS transporter [Roseospira marina]MBB4314247.1 DHA1 family tetracycline resistance protein-like MFS transporter [Roseospira marina]MBB5087407.1 DHA1 family tetracycline resistance protein-like MFS transporter [Roseospira marina]